MHNSHVKIVDDELDQTDKARTVALVHLRKLSRVKNRIRSPLLRLPTETIVHILSFVNDRGYRSDWQAIFQTCHYILRLMLNQTEVWGSVCFGDSVSSMKAAHIAFARSNGNPQKVVAKFGHQGMTENTAGRLYYWRHRKVFQNARLHTLKFTGTPDDFSYFSWILEGPLPRLSNLVIEIKSPLDELGYLDKLDKPVPLQLPNDVPLTTLRLENVTLSCSPRHFTGLRELRLDFSDCVYVTAMPEDELLGILDASPRLERLSLVDLKVDNIQQHPPERVVQLPSLTFLFLENGPEVVGYILARMDVPVITSLNISANIHVPRQDAAQALRLIFPDRRFPERLLSDPLVFKIGEEDHTRTWPSLVFRIGRFKIDFESRTFLEGLTNGVTVWFPLVPRFVATLQGDFSKLKQQEWREFFQSHREVLSIDCFRPEVSSLSTPLWDALSPVQDQPVLCPTLDSVRFRVRHEETCLTSLLNCLRCRKNAGFKLRHLNIDDNYKWDAWKMAEDFRPLVEVLELKFPPAEIQNVSPAPTREADVY